MNKPIIKLKSKDYYLGLYGNKENYAKEQAEFRTFTLVRRDFYEI